MNYKIYLDKNWPQYIKEFSLELAQVLALVNVDLDFPLIDDEKTEGYEYLYLTPGEYKVEGGKISLEKGDRDEFIQVLEEVFGFAQKELDVKEKSPNSVRLEDLYGPGNLKNRDRNGLLQGANFGLSLDSFDGEFLKAGSSIIGRIAIDLESISYPFFKDDGIIRLQRGENYIVYEQDALKISFENLEEFYSICRLEDISKITEFFEKSVRAENREGQLAQALANKDRDYFIDAFSKEKSKEISKKLGFNIKSYKDKSLILEGEEEFQWEGEILKELFKRELNSLEDGMEVICSIDENFQTRKELERELKSLLVAKKKNVKIRIYDSFKEGFSWISEDILPLLKKRPFDSIEIGYTSFQRDKNEKWIDGPGAVPIYESLKDMDENRWLDLPIRLLQELYPIDDLIEKETGVSRDKVEFKHIEGEGFLYKVTVNYKDGVAEYTHVPVFTERDYIEGFENTGKVHPATAYIKIFKNGSLYKYHTFKTDQERIWDYYQRTILPASLIGKSEPIFSQLEMKIDLSGSDYSLGIREDRVSSLDAFHEDLYFVGLDYYKLVGEKIRAKAYSSPGLILPIIHKAKTNPKISWKVYGSLGAEAFYLEEGEKKKLESPYSIVLDKITPKALEYSTDFPYIEELAEIIEKDFWSLDNLINIERIRINDREINVKRRKKENSLKDYIPKAEIYDHLMYMEDIDFLEKVEGLEIEEKSISYSGREIHSIHLERGNKNFTTSYKESNQRPSLYINSRHHANEVSASNSSFQLVKSVAGSRLLEKVNIVIVPMANPDGADIHYQLQEDHPTWIFHVARFNALGREFSLDYFDENTIHTEARVLPKIYHEYLPDVYVDDHGVPSHEWVQQFSGYTSPAYRGFWLPRSLLYGYFWYPKGEGYRENIDYSKAIEDVVAERIRDNVDYKKLNEDLRNRFEKYAHSLMPNTFPADYYKDLIFYWIGFEEDESHRYLSVRFPEIVKVGFTSEVSDETAIGRHLDRCVDAHLQQNLAIIERVAEADIKFDRNYQKLENSIRIRNKRRRKI